MTCPRSDAIDRPAIAVSCINQPPNSSEPGSIRRRFVPMIPTVSKRHYRKGSQLRRAGRADWRTSLLQMVIPDSRAACVLALQPDPALLSEEQRVEMSKMTTGAWRATYVRIEAKRGWRLQCDQPDKVVLD